MRLTRPRLLFLAVAGVGFVSAAWIALTLVLAYPRYASIGAIISYLLCSVFFLVSARFLSALAFNPLQQTRDLVQNLSGGGFRDRLYVTDARDDLGEVQLELNSLMDRMEEAMARQRQFVGAVSHDIRTPLTIMKGDVEVALMKEREPSEYVDILRSNLEEIERIHRLVEDLVTLARADYGELGLNIRGVALGALAAEIREGFLEAARRKSISLESYIEGDIRIEGDAARLRQLIHNLMDNALHYTPSGGKIEVTLVMDGERDEVQLRVRDTGVGISPKDLPHIFEPFYRGTPSRRTRHDGYGLGLAICDHIVRAHGGKIAVESREGPGSGTTFTVHLPLRPRPD